MKKSAIGLLAVCLLTLPAVDDAIAAPKSSRLTAAQIIEKNIAARGGPEAWRKVQTMVWIGTVESANASTPEMPFVLEMKRPNKMRFEIRAQNKMSVRMYDGEHGWKLRPVGKGKPDLQPYSADELRFAHDGQGMDGPLIDYQEKGVAVTLMGSEEVEGHKAYRLSVKLPSGATHDVWIDAQNFLELREDRPSRNALGQPGTVQVYYRDYRAVEGLQMPYLIESGIGSGKTTDKMVIDRIVLNPPLDDRTFARPGPPLRRAASVDTRSPLPGPGALWPARSRFPQSPTPRP